MTLSELIATVRWADVKASLIWGYPDVEASFEDYRRVLKSLRKLEPVPSTMRIIIRKTFPEDLDGASVDEVYGRDGRLNRDRKDFPDSGQSADSSYALAETDFTLALEPWERWLGMAVDPATLADYAPAQIVAHCLWEMTFHGFVPSEVQAKRDELNRLADELDSMTEEERKARFIPWERAITKLKGDDDPKPTAPPSPRPDDHK